MNVHAGKTHSTWMASATLFRSSFVLLKRTVSEGVQQDVPRLGAALAFYTIFAIAPLFVIVLAIAGLWFGEEAARRELFTEVSGLVGSDGGEAIEALVRAAQKPTTGVWATVCVAAFGVLGVLVAAPVAAIVSILHDELYRKRFLPMITDADLDRLSRKALHE